MKLPLQRKSNFLQTEAKLGPEIKTFKQALGLHFADGAADLANDVDEISSLEVQLVWLISLAVP